MAVLDEDRSLLLFHYHISGRCIFNFAGCLLIPGNVAAQEAVDIAPAAVSTQAQINAPALDSAGDIVVIGKRIPGSVIGDVNPVAIFNNNAIQGIGATSFGTLLERLKPLTTSVDGSEPVYLLNGRRISGLAELDNLPPEAIDRVEVLPEAEATRFGFPPTVRVTNFIPKRHFRAVTLQELAGSTTQGRGGSSFAEVNSTRIDGPRRLSIRASHFRQNPVVQSERSILPDLDGLYAVGGTITGVGGSSIDPALDALAGGPVLRAPVPGDAAARRVLGSYLAAPNTAGVTDIGPYRSLQQRSDVVSVSATLASPVGKSLEGSLNLAMEAKGNSGLNGLAPFVLRVPGGSGFLPFTNDVLVYRYVPDAVLHQRSASINLRVGGTLQGGIGRWGWSATGSYDRLQNRSRSDQGVDVSSLQAAVNTGADPLAPIDSTMALRMIQTGETVTGTMVAKAVANGPLMRLPAGDAQMTVTADYARSSSTGTQSSIAGQPFEFLRTTKAAIISANFPIASADQGVLPVLGRLAVNASIGISEVSNYRRLTNTSYGLTWSPSTTIQLTATISDVLTPPDITLLTAPIVVTPNTPVFDFTRGVSVLVTSLTGGRPYLLPERRQRSQFGVALTPIRGKEFRVSLDYIDTRLTNQAATLGAATAAFQAAFPDAFTRDSLGQLTSVDLRPVNLAREHEKRLRLAFNLSTPIGRAPSPAPAALPGGTAAVRVPAKPPKQRPTISAFITATLRLDDRLFLRPGTSALDLLAGDTLNGTGGRPAWEFGADLQGTTGPLSLGLIGRLQGATRIRSDRAEADLFFSGRTWLVPYASLDAGKVVSSPWARNMTLQLTVENLLEDRINVRDRTGTTPNRFQPAYIDPLGRSIRLGVRKMF